MHISPITACNSSLVSPRNVNPRSLRQAPRGNDTNDQRKHEVSTKKTCLCRRQHQWDKTPWTSLGLHCRLPFWSIWQARDHRFVQMIRARCSARRCIHTFQGDCGGCPRVQADRKLLDWTITGNPYQQPVPGPEMEATDIRNWRSWINEFGYLKLFEDLECSWLVLSARDEWSTSLVDFKDI